jgi:hypothetical protein
MSWSSNMCRFACTSPLNSCLVEPTSSGMSRPEPARMASTEEGYRSPSMIGPRGKDPSMARLTASRSSTVDHSDGTVRPHLHVKDFAFTRKDGWMRFTFADCRLGEGLLDYDGMIRTVRPDERGINQIIEHWLPWQGDSATTITLEDQRTDTFGGIAAPQDVVAALESGTEEKIKIADEVIRAQPRRGHG